MIELIVVMIIVGIMAVTVLPRMSLLGGFEAAGFRDQTVAILRYAQKSALAQRRAVCVTTSDTRVEPLLIATTATDDTCATSTVLTLPFTARPGTGLQAKTFNFLRKGETNQSSVVITLTITGASPDITIDAVTGYVR
jgi:MSHA pilin protein MshC